MKRSIILTVSVIILLISHSCGIEGDPGHCYISIDWEYYNDEYGVYYYEDNNPDVPEGINIEANYYYDSYPGTYEYYYESEDYEFWYSYEGDYTLIQNPGQPARVFEDGMDGLDTYLDLYLYVIARKSVKTDHEPATLKTMLNSPVENRSNELVRIEDSNWEVTKGEWTILFTQTMSVYRK